MTTTTTEAFETGLRAEFEALARVSEMSVKRNAAGNGYTHLMTQVAWDFYRAATERAAKLVETCPPPRKNEGGRVEVGERARGAFAAAIRASSGKGEA